MLQDARPEVPAGSQPKNTRGYMITIVIVLSVLWLVVTALDT